MIAIVVLVSIVVLAAGYFTYGRLVTRRLDLDDSRPTPACEMAVARGCRVGLIGLSRRGHLGRVRRGSSDPERLAARGGGPGPLAAANDRGAGRA
jgi:hypothetical protein